jgi:hypothetical protein
MSKGLPTNVINDFLMGNCSLKESVYDFLKSNYHLGMPIDVLGDGLAYGTWKKAMLPMAWSVQYPDVIEFWHHNLMECTKKLLQPPEYEKYHIYTSKCCYNNGGHCVDYQIYSGDWWWDEQVSILLFRF